MSALLPKADIVQHAGRVRYLASDCYGLRLRPDGGQEYSYRNSDGNFEEPMGGDHPCGLGTRYEHDDG
jgi:hypothetical protein